MLQELSRLGVSIWLDDLSRSLVRSGRLADLVRDRCVVGVTSKPTIFATALADTVNTMPPATLQAATTATVPGPLDSAGQRDPEAVAGELTALGVDLAQVARQLEDKAVQLFQDSYVQLVDTVTAALNAAGADVHTDGTARPVGGGQRPAAPADSG